MFSNPTAITFVGYLLVMVCVGFYAYYHTRSYGDYILGGRSLGGFVTALSVGASDMSGWLLMGLPGAVYLAGISQSWIGIGLVLGSYITGASSPPACASTRRRPTTRSRSPTTSLTASRTSKTCCASSLPS